MRQKTRIFIYILIAIVVVIMGTLAILKNHQVNGSVSAQEHIDLGRIYLTELSYEKAALEFTEAIEIEPLNADAYLGLAEAYVGMGDTAKAVEVLENGYDRTGDERLRDMLYELQPPEETTVTTTAADIEVTTEETSAENITETESETSEIITETANDYPHKIYDTNASYTINVISDKEAHIEIFSEIINDEYEIGYIPELNHDTWVAWLVMCRINLDNISVAFSLPNLPDYFTSYKSWTWNDLYKLYDFVGGAATVMIHNEDGSYDNIISYKQYEFQWYVYMEIDTSQNKLSFDVILPENIDFSFNDYSNSELTVFYYK